MTMAKASITRSNQRPSAKILALLASVTILALSTVGRIGSALRRGGIGRPTTDASHAAAVSSRASASSSSMVSAFSAAAGGTTGPSTRILCYGDSLTAGTSPPLDGLFPYGPHLEKAVNENLAKLPGGGPPPPPAVIRWRGLPGWTSAAMVDASTDPTNGLKPALAAVKNPSISLVIVLAGTNDLAYATDSESILKNVVSLHELCFKEGVRRTVAVGIPGSGWQAQSEAARKIASEVNEGLRQYCEGTTVEAKNSNRGGVGGGTTSSGENNGAGAVATFVPFPFPWGRDDKRWGPDGLHLSPEGYAALGVGLAPTVTTVLTELHKERQGQAPS